MVDGMDTEISSCLTYKWRVRINQDGLYNKKEGAPTEGLGKMAKTESLPAHLQEKDSRGDDYLTLYERHEKPTASRSRPSLSNPRSSNDIVRVFSRANPTLLRSATNRVPTIYIYTIFKIYFVFKLSLEFWYIIYFF